MLSMLSLWLLWMTKWAIYIQKLGNNYRIKKRNEMNVFAQYMSLIIFLSKISYNYYHVLKIVAQKHGSQVCFCATTLCCGYHFPAVSSFPCTPEFLSLFLLHLHNSLGQETLTLHCSNCPFPKQDGRMCCGQRGRHKTIFWLPVSYIRSSQCIQRSFAHWIYTLSRAIKVYQYTVPTFRWKPIYYCHCG